MAFLAYFWHVSSEESSENFDKSRMCDEKQLSTCLLLFRSKLTAKLFDQSVCDVRVITAW